MCSHRRQQMPSRPISFSSLPVRRVGAWELQGSNSAYAGVHPIHHCQAPSSDLALGHVEFPTYSSLVPFQLCATLPRVALRSEYQLL